MLSYIVQLGATLKVYYCVVRTPVYDTPYFFHEALLFLVWTLIIKEIVANREIIER